MKTFSNGQRVVVSAVAVNDLPIPPTAGTVWRLRIKDNGAWVHLDVRLADEFHPFPANDASGRATSVLAYPENCTPEAAK